MHSVSFVHSLEKVFPDEAPKAFISSFSMFKKERYAIQLVLYCDREETALRLLPPEFLKNHLKIFRVGLIPVSDSAFEKCNDDFILREGKMDKCPDLLEPVDWETTLRGRGYRALWLEIDGQNLESGNYQAVFTVETGDGKMEASLNMTVIDAELPKQELDFTNWFYCDCLADYYHVEIFSEEHWRIIENYVRFAAQHGMTMILTPLFTPPLDTEVGTERPTVQLVDVNLDENGYSFSFSRLERWISLCERAGISQFEMAPFFTQWGAKFAPKIVAKTRDGEKKIFGWETPADGEEYTTFLRAFAPELNQFMAEKGIADRCYFHISDEPGEDDFPRYEKHAKLLRSLFHGAGFIDALSEYRFYEAGLTDIPVPCVDKLTPFLGHVKNLWTYYCCAQADSHIVNRFFLFPSVRNRALGFGLYHYNCKGFLHWGYNFWYTCLSKAKVDPYRDASAGGEFGDGDAFSVYPGKNGEPLPSVRLKVLYDAFQDERAMRLLESLVGEEKARQTLENFFPNYSMNNYPKTELEFAELREKINHFISEQIKKTE